MASRPKEGGVEYIQIDGLVSNFHMIIYVRIKPTGCKISMAYSLASLNKQNLKYWCWFVDDNVEFKRNICLIVNL